MALIVTDNSVRQINAALLSLEKKIGETNSEKAQDKQVVQMELKNVQYDFMAPLYQSGNSVSINTTGTWEGNARSATTAEHAFTADNAEHADTATSADTATTATTAETANKVKNALTVNGKTYDGSSAVNVGVQTVANGGTGQTTAIDAANSFINSLSTGSDIPVDKDYFISQYVSGGTTSTSYHRRPLSKLWEYIKGKISSVLGLTATNYGGKASTAGTADNAANAEHATNANITKTTDTVNGDKLQIGSGTAQNVTNAKHAATAEHAITADNGIPTYSTSDAGKNLAVNSSGNAVGWVKPQTIKFVDYRTDNLTFSSLTDQKRIELSKFGPEVTENNVLSFMAIYYRNTHIIAQADWSKSQGTGSTGMACALHSLNTGTGYAVIRCVYLA